MAPIMRQMRTFLTESIEWMKYLLLVEKNAMAFKQAISYPLQVMWDRQDSG